ncbi:hypothetical protein CsSME_00015885 [Camellia sinensis var. sinensis]
MDSLFSHYCFTLRYPPAVANLSPLFFFFCSSNPR